VLVTLRLKGEWEWDSWCRWDFLQGGGEKWDLKKEHYKMAEEASTEKKSTRRSTKRGRGGGRKKGEKKKRKKGGEGGGRSWNF